MEEYMVGMGHGGAARAAVDLMGLGAARRTGRPVLPASISQMFLPISGRIGGRLAGDNVHHPHPYHRYLFRTTGTGLVPGASQRLRDLAALGINMPANSVVPRIKAKHLLDHDALSALLMCLFVPDSVHLTTGRLQRLLRNMCYHAPTRQWIIAALLDLVERAKTSVQQQGNTVKEISDADYAR